MLGVVSIIGIVYSVVETLGQVGVEMFTATLMGPFLLFHSVNVSFQLLMSECIFSPSELILYEKRKKVLGASILHVCLYIC